MSPDTKVKLAESSELSIGQLAARDRKLFGEKCRARTTLCLKLARPRRYRLRHLNWELILSSNIWYEKCTRGGQSVAGPSRS